MSAVPNKNGVWCWAALSSAEQAFVQQQVALRVPLVTAQPWYPTKAAAQRDFAEQLQSRGTGFQSMAGWEAGQAEYFVVRGVLLALLRSRAFKIGNQPQCAPKMASISRSWMKEHKGNSGPNDQECRSPQPTSDLFFVDLTAQEVDIPACIQPPIFPRDCERGISELQDDFIAFAPASPIRNVSSESKDTPPPPPPPPPPKRLIDRITYITDSEDEAPPPPKKRKTAAARPVTHRYNLRRRPQKSKQT